MCLFDKHLMQLQICDNKSNFQLHIAMLVYKENFKYLSPGVFKVYKGMSQL